MNVSKVTLFKTKGEKVLSMGSIVISESISLKVRVQTGKNGIWVKVGESNKGNDGKYYDSVIVFNKELREEISTKVLAEHAKVTAQA